MKEVNYREASEYKHIAVKPCTCTVGAEIGNIDIRENLSDEVISEVRRALLEWRVIFFRDQDITTEDHLRFAAYFGELEVHPFAPQKPGYPEILVIDNNDKTRGRENTWHSDVTWRAEPSLGSILRAIELPSHGGDTLFSDQIAAYEGLTDEIKSKIEGLKARHSIHAFLDEGLKRGISEEDLQKAHEAFPDQTHPVVRTHPETGEKGLYVNSVFTQEINGIDPKESEELLAHLYAQATIPEYQVRLRWQKNTMAFWDNRAVQHYAASDYFPQRRLVERATVIGDVPV